MTLIRRALLLMVCVAAPSHAQQRINRGVAPPPPPGSMFLIPERVALRDGKLVEGERGLVFVPMNRSDTSRGVIGVEVWRFRALQPTNAPPVFRLPGGPGHDGLHVNLAQQGYYERVILPTLRFADYIIVGQRGMYTSPPHTICEQVAGVERSRRCREDWEKAGLDVRGFTVVEAAHDVADVARALGYDSIVVRGGSFGSHWTLALMRLHPRLVARALLSGTEGPDHTYDMPADLLNALKRIASAAEASPELAALMPKGGLIGALDSLRIRLRAAPVIVSVVDSATGTSQEIRYTSENLPSFAFGYTGSAHTRGGLRNWPAEVLRVFYGDYMPAARRLAGRIASQSTWPFSYGTAGESLLDCASAGSAARVARIAREPAKELVGDAGVPWEIQMCAPWQVDLGDAFRRNFETNIPTLVVHGTWDLSTPYENALELMPHLRRGKLVTVRGGTHAALAEASNFDRNFAAAIDAFLQTGSTSALPDSVVLPPIEWTVPPDLRTLAAQRRQKAAR
jgi:pimeloyl-ACP methyl ester carboxylesterase